MLMCIFMSNIVSPAVLGFNNAPLNEDLVTFNYGFAPKAKLMAHLIHRGQNIPSFHDPLIKGINDSLYQLFMFGKYSNLFQCLYFFKNLAHTAFSSTLI